LRPWPASGDARLAMASAVLLWAALTGGSDFLMAGQSASLEMAQLPAAHRFDFPLRVSANGRFLVDQKNRPLLVVGDTGWSLIVQLDEAGARRYLDDRQQRGLNATIVNLLEHKFCSSPPQTRSGLRPFRVAGDFSTPNEAYFDYAHRIVEQ